MGSSVTWCWFCGNQEDRKWEGHCLARMVYSSEAVISHEELCGGDRSSGAELHYLNDRVAICRNCVMRFASDIHIPPGYIASQITTREEASWEAFDFDTQLIEWSERNRFFSCWFDCYSSKDLNRPFKSLSLIELFNRGYRLRGNVRFEEPQISLFLERFGELELDWSNSFVRHIGRHVKTANQSLLPKFAGVRATICDLTVVEFALRDLDNFPDTPRPSKK